MIRKGLKPRIKVALDLADDNDGFRRTWPFRRSWIAIALLAVFDAVFIIPAVMTFQQAASEWGQFDSLFDLTGAMFLSAWLMGWSIGPLLMTGILLLMLFGREVIKVRPGSFEIFIGLPLLGITARYDPASMRNLRYERAPKKSGKSWRGSHLAFDYGANTIAVGSDISGAEVANLKNRIETVAGRIIRCGEARPDEVQGRWEAREDFSQAVGPEPPPAVPDTLSSPSIQALVIANLVPVAGASFLGWDLSDVMVLYWAESAVIGFFNVCKIVVISRWMALLAVPFFIGHFGGFMAIHFLFIYTIFIQGIRGMNDTGESLAEVAQLFVVLWPALAALFVSHAFSFFKNFIGQREYHGKTIQNQMSEPYSRIIFMHLVIIFGGGLTMILGGATPVLLIVIALKIWFDIRAHLKERGSRQERA